MIPKESGGKMSLFEKAAQLEKENRAFALITITSSRGSAPRNQGRMIVLPEGELLGTVGGGPAEKYVTEEAMDALKAGESRTVSYKLDSGESPNSIDMVCGGDMDFFVEVFLPRPSLFLSGGGHVNLALSRLADFLKFPYIVGDTRKGMAGIERYPHALAHIAADDSAGMFRQAMEKNWISRETSILIATHNHDETALKEALKTPAAYIGMLGSKRKVHLFFEKMRKEGFSDKDLRRVYSPVGLDIGTETPEEIAVSIMAEIMKVQSGSSGNSLSLFRKDSPPLAIVRGAGDLATGTISKLHRCGFQVAALEIPHPTVIRRTVSFAQAVFDREVTVEGVTAVYARTLEEMEKAWLSDKVPVLADPEGHWIRELSPPILIDAIIAKKNLGTHKEMAPVVIALGPGFTAGEDVHAVIETNRGHNLGKVITQGPAAPNTGIPGNIAGHTQDRVVRSPARGKLTVRKDIGSFVKKGELIAKVGSSDITSPLDGVIRGMIADGTSVTEGFKIADVDPRGDETYCRIISDKARAIAGGVLEAILRLSPDLIAGGRV